MTESLEKIVSCKNLHLNNSNRQRSFLIKKARSIAAWSHNHLRKTSSGEISDKVYRETVLTLFSSFYVGNLTSGEQLKWAKRLNLSKGTFTKYNSSRGFPIFLGLTYFGIFNVLKPSLNLIPGFEDFKNFNDGLNIGYGVYAGTSFAINAGRYYVSKVKDKAFPAISLYSLVINIAHNLGRGIAWGVKKLKDQNL